MARSSRRPTRVSRLSFIQVIRRGPSPAAKGLVVAALGIAAGVWFWWSPGSRGWFVESLGYGWIPVGVWLAVAMAAIVHYRSAVRQSWRWCVVAGALAAISVGVLSLFHTGSGTLADTGLGGRWGQVLGRLAHRFGCSQVGCHCPSFSAGAPFPASGTGLLARVDLRWTGFLLHANLHIQRPSLWLAVPRPACRPAGEPRSPVALSLQARLGAAPPCTGLAKIAAGRP